MSLGRRVPEKRVCKAASLFLGLENALELSRRSNVKVKCHRLQDEVSSRISGRWAIRHRWWCGRPELNITVDIRVNIGVDIGVHIVFGIDVDDRVDIGDGGAKV